LALVYVFAIVMTTNEGPYGPGIIYLFATTILSVLIFFARIGYLTIALHVFFSILFLLIINSNVFHSTFRNNYSINSWISVTSSLIFLSLIGVLLIGKIINGLENTLIEEVKLHLHLDSEATKRAELDLKLTESKGHYKSIFNQNPSPRWVMDSNNLPASWG
jgi:hypothetical protein